MTLVVLAAPEFDLDIALAYATPENVTGKPIYACAEAQLHPDAAAALSRAIALAASLGLRFRLFDAFRPVEAQWRSEEHTSEIQSLMSISSAVFCLKQKNLIH